MAVFGGEQVRRVAGLVDTVQATLAGLRFVGAGRSGLRRGGLRRAGIAGRRGRRGLGGRRLREEVRGHGELAVLHRDGGELVAVEVVDDVGAACATQAQEQRLIAGARVERAVVVLRERHHVAGFRVVVDAGLALGIDREHFAFGAGGRVQRLLLAVVDQRPDVLGTLRQGPLTRRGLATWLGTCARVNCKHLALGHGRREQRVFAVVRERRDHQLLGLGEHARGAVFDDVHFAFVARAHVGRAAGQDQERACDGHTGELDALDAYAAYQRSVRGDRRAFELAFGKHAAAVEHEGARGTCERRNGCAEQAGDDQETKGSRANVHRRGSRRTLTLTRAEPVTT